MVSEVTSRQRLQCGVAEARLPETLTTTLHTGLRTGDSAVAQE